MDNSLLAAALLGHEFQPAKIQGAIELRRELGQDSSSLGGTCCGWCSTNTTPRVGGGEETYSGRPEEAVGVGPRQEREARGTGAGDVAGTQGDAGSEFGKGTSGEGGEEDGEMMEATGRCTM
jgi:hypothetical protein